MEKTTQTAKTSQGDKVAQDKTAGDKKTERNPSQTYTLKSFRGVVEKLGKAKMVTPEEYETLKKLHKTVLIRWIGLEIGES